MNITRSLLNIGTKQGGIGSVFGQHVVPRGLSRTTPVCCARLAENTSASPSSGSSWLPQTGSSPRLFHTSNLSYSQPSSELTVGEPDRLYSQIEVECRGHEPAVLRSYNTFVSTAAGHLSIPVEDVLWPKKHIKRWTLLKSVHIYKHHRVQYEVRTHFLVMKFARLTGSTADTFLDYIQRNLPEGVAMKVTKHELHKLPEHVKPSSEVVV
ncbi:28S ribosomal protein S10, mitochondrial-like [Homarus americanus]|uniref:28S ribosomal protein S10-like n=1 Tax=Homarus americanus TaxID=6706 RepID=A0A8J5MPP7_HOMAM|nr:28S ribosomal protein S10, mitochondrial-like [Homarus americanus]XP_042239779.1 28S ribosomal protein S10, mitochondrial-like [Homarus americanus]KAG7159186.1 28S ribosomal protein S10-like [Homarus americanus]